MIGFNGGLLGKEKLATTTVASGVWSLSEHSTYKSANLWPGVPTAIYLTGSSSALEGTNASYSVRLDNVGMGVGASVTLTLDGASVSAIEGGDFALSFSSSLVASAGVTLSNITVNPTTGAVTLSATNTSGSILSTGAQLLTFNIPIALDSIAEGNETFTVNLSSALSPVGTASITTTIFNVAVTWEYSWVLQNYSPFININLDWWAT